MPTISVIVPVYKVEPYLNRCVDSVLRQTYRDFELILVDDGSPDRCGEICDEYARQDSRVHVIHKENGGLSDARNAGIDWVEANSDSRWLIFADSDDWVHPELLARLLDAATAFDLKISVCGYQETEGADPAVLPEDMRPCRWTPKQFYMEHFVNATVAWGKLYSRSCFRDIRYPVGKIHEDEFVTYRLLFAQEAIAVVPGLSRSGTTISAGLMRGFSRKFAVRFSFLMSIPAVLGANILSIAEAVQEGIDTSLLPAYLIGTAVAAVSGYFAIGLVNLLTNKGKFGNFAYYCWGIGAAAVVASLIFHG